MEKIKNNDKKLKFNNSEMEKYYQGFDPIEYKYSDFYKKVIEENDSEYETKKEILIEELTKHERSKNFADLTKKDFEYTVSNLKMIYGDEKFARFVVKIYHLIYTNVISLYINIDGVERLFNDKYANFEWELHLGMDYNSHDMNYYRDHFIHQVKDAYMMDKLLTEFGYIDYVKEILRVESNSKISAFVTKYINIQLEKSDFFADRLLNEADKMEYFLENIIKMSSYMAALFHDIGYPIVANIEGNQNIMDYIFETYNLNDCNIDFNKITTLLSNSLLFRVESISRIKKRVEGNVEAGQKIDHGAISAIIFLLHFYENGAIHRLEPYKICAVELAGLAIYNHTNKYTYICEKKKDYERNVFFQNPISHLLRICDDLQEWGRIYFQISDQSNIIICDRCKTPIVRKESSGNYVCHCSSKNLAFSKAFSDEGFHYRRIFKVTTCEEVEFIKKDKIECIKIDYNLNRLLHIAYVAPTYAKYRCKELREIKKLFLKQKVPFKTYIKSFMSANIIAIKSEIVGQKLFKALEKNASCIKSKLIKLLLDNRNIGEIIEAFVDSVITDEKNIVSLDDKNESIYYKEYCDFGFLQKTMGKIDSISCVETKEYLKKALKIYSKLYLYTYMVSLFNDIEMKEYKKIFAENIEKYIENVEEQCMPDKKYNKHISVMVKDYFRYAKNRIFEICKYPYYPNEYFDEFKSKNELYVHIAAFCDSSKYQYEKLPDSGIDAYSDLYLFKILENL